MRRTWLLIIAALALPLTLATPASAALTVQDVAAQVGIYEVNLTFHTAPYDYNRDGRTDLWIGYHNKGGKLFRNDGGIFTRVDPTAWPARVDRHDCAWAADVNGDGRADQYCTVGRTAANNVKDATHDNELWLQQADGTFLDRGTAWGLGDPYGRGRATTFLNANGDQWPDLFVGNELPREGTDPTGGENKLFLGTGTGFTRAPGFGLNQFVGAFCAHPIDYNRDGRQDLFLCGSKRSVLYRNNGGTGFTEVTASSGIIQAKRRDADFGDLDGDGDLDAVSINTLDLKIQLNAGGIFDTPRTIMSLVAGRETALGDADGDGDLDIYVLQTASGGVNRPDYILLNDRLSFTTRLSVPAAGGSGDAVETLDYDRNGTADFVVLNGNLSTPGPTQLLRVRAS
jgi:FG-GAP-like repeat